MDFKSIGKAIFGGVHLAGKTILSAYGLGSVAQSAEQFESPLLPDWAKSNKKAAAGVAAADGVATRPDYAVVVYADGSKKPELVAAPDLVNVSGGKRFDGNGYKSGDPLGSKFSFGWDSPKKVDILVKGKPVSYPGVQQVLILGGKEAASTRVAGFERSQVMGILGDDFSILGAQVLGDLESAEVAINETGYSTMHIPDEPTEVLSDTYIFGCDIDILGAAPPLVAPRGGFVVKQGPATGRTFTSLKLTRPKKGDHATSIKNAQTVAKRAQDLATKLEKLKPPPKKQAVHGLTPARQQRRAMSVAQLKQLAAPLKKTASKIGGNATKHGTTVATNLKNRTAGVKRVQKITKPTTTDKPNVLGADDWTEILGLGQASATHAQAFADAQARLAAAKAARAAFDTARLANLTAPAPGVGDTFAVNLDDPSGVDVSLSPQDLPRYDYEHGVDWGDAPVMGDEFELLGAAAPDPANPGYLTDGTLDPGYWGATPTDPSAPDAGATGGPPDYGVGPAPTTAPPLVEGIDYVRDPGVGKDINFYSSTKEPGTVPVPIGAQVYDGSQAFPDKGIGSFTYFYKNLPGGAKPKGGNGSGYFWNKDHWTNWWASSYHDGIAIDKRKHPLNPEEAASLPTMAKNSKNGNWGPLIGNPNLEWTKGLRYDSGGNQWFWFYDQAPSWAKAAGEAERLNQAVLDYQADLGAAQMDYTSQQIVDGLAKDQADELARTTAASDTALQHQIDNDTKVSQADAARQQLLDDAAQRQAAAQQQLDLQQWQAQSQSDQQRSQQEMQFQLEREKAMMAMMAEHPEMAATLMPALAPAPSQGGGDEGYQDEGYPDDAYVADDGQVVDWGEDDRDVLDER